MLEDHDHFAESAPIEISRGPDFQALYADSSGPEPERPPAYVAPYEWLSRDERASLNQTNTARALQGRPDLSPEERRVVIKHVRLSSYIPIP